MEISLDPWKVALGSSLLGGTFTLIGQLFSFSLQRKTKAAQDMSEIKSLLQSFYVEIETLHELYMISAGHAIQERKFPNGVDISFIADENYMTVFDNNAHQIGKIKNDALRKSIVEAYTTAKSLLDTYKSNRMIQLSIFDLQMDLAKYPDSKQIEQFIDIKKQDLKRYAANIEFIDQKYHQKVKEALSLIQTEIST